MVFEGEYLNGKRWNGKGIEYNIDGTIEFEGIYLNGKKINEKENSIDIRILSKMFKGKKNW